MLSIIFWILAVWFLTGLAVGIFTSFFYCRGLTNMGEWIKVTIKNPSKETLNIEPIILGTTMFFAFIILGLISIVIMAGFILSVNDHILTEKIQKEGND